MRRTVRSLEILPKTSSPHGKSTGFGEDGDGDGAKKAPTTAQPHTNIIRDHAGYPRVVISLTRPCLALSSVQTIRRNALRLLTPYPLHLTALASAAYPCGVCLGEPHRVWVCGHVLGEPSGVRLRRWVFVGRVRRSRNPPKRRFINP